MSNTCPFFVQKNHNIKNIINTLIPFLYILNKYILIYLFLKKFNYKIFIYRKTFFNPPSHM